MNNEEALDRIAGTNPNRHAFWKRQFARTQTTPQLAFDVVVGAVAPVLCFYFDPIVFQGQFEGPLYGDFQVFAYLVTVIEVPALLLWLSLPRPNALGSFLGGVLIAGSVFSAMIGIAILPFSLPGVVGFTPFLTAFVHLRNGRRAWQSDVDSSVKRSWIAPVLMGFILALGLPAFASVEVSRILSNAINTILHGDAVQAEVAINQLKQFPFIQQTKLDEIVESYRQESDENRKQRLRKVYLEITGVDLEVRARLISD